MQKPNYKQATNAAYRVLIENPTFSFATNVLNIIEQQLTNCKVLTYGQACILYGYTMDLLLANSEYGFSFKHGKYRIILYNENIPLNCTRFTLAHEIGHVVLGHRKEDDPIAEKEANCFARNLLCPVTVSDMLHLTSPKDYVNLFDVSSQMSNIAFDWKQTDQYYITPDNYAEMIDIVEAYARGFDSVSDFYYYYNVS